MRFGVGSGGGKPHTQRERERGETKGQSLLLPPLPSHLDQSLNMSYYVVVEKSRSMVQIWSRSSEVELLLHGGTWQQTVQCVQVPKKVSSKFVNSWPTFVLSPLPYIRSKCVAQCGCNKILFENWVSIHIFHLLSLSLSLSAIWRVKLSLYELLIHPLVGWW